MSFERFVRARKPVPAWRASLQHGPTAAKTSCAAACSRCARSRDGTAADRRGARARTRDRDAHPHTRTAATRPATPRTHAAAQLVLSWSHRGRTSEAAFARLARAAPIPASSGQTIRYRLDRSGDRKLNGALHMILVTRRRAHPATIAYIERRIQKGKTRRETNRYLAGNVYRPLEHGPPIATWRT